MSGLGSLRSSECFRQMTALRTAMTDSMFYSFMIQGRQEDCPCRIYSGSTKST